MTSQTIKRLRAFRLNALAIIGLLATSFLLWCQQDTVPQPVLSAATQPFIGVDESLNRIADSLLASTVLSTISDSDKRKESKSTLAILSPNNAQQALSRSEMHNNAASRVASLRPTVDPILMNYGIPVDLAAVILVESGGSLTALSPKGAHGPWQLMPNTARRYGLRVDQIRDERIDLSRATDAAARYLHDLYAQFGDWKLALAAYNTGEVNVENAIEKAHTQDFEQLSNLRMLPLETRNYVPRVLATALFFSHSFDSKEDRNLSSIKTVFAVSIP